MRRLIQRESRDAGSSNGTHDGQIRNNLRDITWRADCPFMRRASLKFLRNEVKNLHAFVAL